MKCIIDDIHIGDIWESKFYKGSMAEVTSISHDLIIYDYIFGEGEIRAREVAHGSMICNDFIRCFNSRKNLSRINKICKCVKKIRKLAIC